MFLKSILFNLTFKGKYFFSLKYKDDVQIKELIYLKLYVNSV